MKFREYVSEATIDIFKSGSMSKGWKKLTANKYLHQHDKIRDVLVRHIPGGWEIRFMKELSPGEPPAPMTIKKGYKTAEDAMKAAEKMMDQKRSWDK